jgi:hypothetical protein
VAGRIEAGQTEWNVMPKDPQMKIVRQQINAVIDRCAVAAEMGGAQAVLALKIPETDELPPSRGVVVSPEYAAHLAAVARTKGQEQ